MMLSMNGRRLPSTASVWWLPELRMEEVVSLSALYVVADITAQESSVNNIASALMKYSQ